MQNAISQLYTVFSKYKFDPQMWHAQITVSREWKAELYSKPLREIPTRIIGIYAFKAITTWGKVENFKFYLPRILEVLTFPNNSIQIFVLFGKFEMADWKNWPVDEQNALHNFLIAWWHFLHTKSDYFCEECLVGICQITQKLPYLLATWQNYCEKLESVSLLHLINFISFHFEELKNNKSKHELANLSAQDKLFLLDWLLVQKTHLEKALLRVKDEVLKLEIENAIYCLEK